MLLNTKWTNDKFLSARKLNIRADHRKALIEVLRRLECGEIGFIGLSGEYWDTTSPDDRDYINMAAWRSGEGCRTICCIGGWMEIIGGFIVNKSAELEALFSPRYIDCRGYSEISVDQIIKAVRYFLCTGKGSDAWVHALLAREA